MTYQLQTSTGEVVEFGNILEVTAGAGRIARASEASSAFESIYGLVERDGAIIDPAYEMALREEATAALRLPNLHERGEWLANTLLAVIPQPEPDFPGVWLAKAGARATADRIAAVAEGEVPAFRKAISRILTTMESAYVPAAKAGRAMPSPKRVIQQADREMPKLYRGAIEAGIETIGVKKRATEWADGEYEYGKVAANGTLSLDIDAMVASRLERLGVSITNIDKRIREKLGRVPRGGWSTEQVDDLIDMFESMLDTDGWADVISETEAWAAFSGGRTGGAFMQGAKSAKWIDRHDKRVRPTHTVYGAAPPKKIGFNYARLTKGSYILRWPYDDQCEEPGEIVGCRCIWLPEL